MNKIAILPLKEMPSSCSKCSFKRSSIRMDFTFICSANNNKKIYNWDWNTTVARNCPLISIDIGELKANLDFIGNIDFRFMQKLSSKQYEYYIRNSYEFNTIKSTIDKLGGTK